MSAQKYIIPGLLLLTVLLIYRNLYYRIPTQPRTPSLTFETEKKSKPRTHPHTEPAPPKESVPAPTKPSEPQSKPVEQKPITPEEQPTAEEVEELAPLKPKMVTLQNDITRKMLGYKYFITYYPTKFDVYANDIHVVTLDKKHRPESTGTILVPLKDGKLVMRYEYEFMGGSRKGAKQITYHIDSSIDQLTMTFDWTNEWRLKLDNATPLSIERLKVSEDAKEE